MIKAVKAAHLSWRCIMTFLLLLLTALTASVRQSCKMIGWQTYISLFNSRSVFSPRSKSGELLQGKRCFRLMRGWEINTWWDRSRLETTLPHDDYPFRKRKRKGRESKILVTFDGYSWSRMNHWLNLSLAQQNYAIQLNWKRRKRGMTWSRRHFSSSSRIACSERHRTGRVIIIMISNLSSKKNVEEVTASLSSFLSLIKLVPSFVHDSFFASPSCESIIKVAGKEE